MTELMHSQLDFVYFFYGLAFILLSGVCLSTSGGGQRRDSLVFLGAFALLHGLAEWSDLLALLIGDKPAFAWARTGLMAASFVPLLEYVRVSAGEIGLPRPSPGWYLILILPLVYCTFATDVQAANVVVRYVLAFPGALGTAAVYLLRASKLEGPAKRLKGAAAAGFAAYAFAAGLVVPKVSWWPASNLNQEWFSLLAGVPIQLVRGVLACWIALAVWGIWKYSVAVEISSERYTKHVDRMARSMFFGAALILATGWSLTEYLGEVRTRSLARQSQIDMTLLTSRLDGDMARLDKLVQTLAASPLVLPIVEEASRSEREVAAAVLDVGVAGTNADAGFILDRSGRLIAGSRAVGATDPHVLAYGHTRSFRDALAGKRGHDILLDPTRGTPNFYASVPVYAGGAEVGAVAVVEVNVDNLARELNGSDFQFFIVDSTGRILLTNRPGSTLQPLWESAAARGSATAGPPPLLDREALDGEWRNLDGERRYVRRGLSADGHWSVVLVMPAAGQFASRFLGIIVTLLMSIMVLVYLHGKDRAIRDQIDLERRLKLQQLAQDLQARTHTDPLTGVNNRARFDEELEGALDRGARYNTPFSVILFDVDHFKRVNDSHGHLAGDNVLIGLAKLVSGSIRSPDVLARWGGEEFVILSHGPDIHSARMVAERLRAQIAADRFPQVGQVTCSFGVAHCVPGDTTRSLLVRADQALYLAKKRGRNRVEFVIDEPDESGVFRSVG